MNDSAARLMKAFREGDKNAFEKMYKRFHNRIFFFVRKKTNNREEAEEITSETFVRLWQLHNRFETLSNVQAFLFIAARNLCLDYLRYIQKVAGDAKDYSYTTPEIDESSLEREMIEAEALQMIFEEIEKLPGQCRKVIKMSFLEQLKNKDIAEQLQIELRTVKNHKTNGLNRIRRAIEIWVRKRSGE